MDFNDIMNLSNSADTLSGVMVYIIAGLGSLFVILLIVWLLFKLSAFIKSKKGTEVLKEQPTDEELLFGE